MERNMLGLTAKIVMLIIITIMLFAYYNRDFLNNSLACEKQDDFKLTEYSGIVVRKYSDQKNHKSKNIEVNSASKISNIILSRDTTNFYDFINIGDSLLKVENSKTINVYRGSRVYKFDLYFGCGR